MHLHAIAPAPMLQSMTAFVRYPETLSWGSLSWEVRSLNYRYLEVDINVPAAYRHLETALRELVRQRVDRGRLTCSLTVTYQDATLGFHIDRDLLKQVLSALKEIRDHDPQIGRANDIELLRWPGVMMPGAALGEPYDDAVKESLGKAMDQVVDRRGKEGKELQSYLVDRFDEIQELLANLKDRLKNIASLRRASMLDAVKGIINLTELSSGRLEQEVALLVSKFDVSEEIERLEVHLSDSREMVTKPGPHGRQLDFVMQEMNREANTLGAKVHQVEAGRIALRIRSAVDQVREQVQNIE